MPVTRTRTREEGSLVVALAVVIVLSGLAAAITTRTLSALGNARLNQDQSSATAAADAGLTDALFALDQWTPPAVAPTTGSGTTASGTYAWTVTTLDGLHA